MESKPQIYILTQLPFLECCPDKMYEKLGGKEGKTAISRWFNEKLPAYYDKLENELKEKNVKVINMFKHLKDQGLSNEFLCAEQPSVSFKDG